MTTPAIPADVYRTVDQLLWRKARNQNRRTMLTKSYRLRKETLNAEIAEVDHALREIFDVFGEVETVSGRVEKAKGWLWTPGPELIEWVRENRPGLIDEKIHLTALKEAGAKQVGARLLLEGEVVPGAMFERSSGVSISVATANLDAYSDADVPDDERDVA